MIVPCSAALNFSGYSLYFYRRKVQQKLLHNYLALLVRGTGYSIGKLDEVALTPSFTDSLPGHTADQIGNTVYSELAFVVVISKIGSHDPVSKLQGRLKSVANDPVHQIWQA